MNILKAASVDKLLLVWNRTQKRCFRCIYS